MGLSAYFMTTQRRARSGYTPPSFFAYDWQTLENVATSGTVATSTAPAGYATVLKSWGNGGGGLRAAFRAVLSTNTGTNTASFNDTYAPRNAVHGFEVRGTALWYIHSGTFADANRAYAAGDVLICEMWDDSVRFMLNNVELVRYPQSSYFGFLPVVKMQNQDVSWDIQATA